jgi:hypothetical protein
MVFTEAETAAAGQRRPHHGPDMVITEAEVAAHDRDQAAASAPTVEETDALARANPGAAPSPAPAGHARWWEADWDDAPGPRPTPSGIGAATGHGVSGEGSAVTSTVRRLESWVDREAHNAASTVRGVPILGPVASAAAGGITRATEVAGGVVNGVGRMGEGVVHAAQHPVDTVVGLGRMAEHSVGPLAAIARTVHHGANVITGDETLGQAADHTFDPVTIVRDDAAFAADTVAGQRGTDGARHGGMAEPYRDAIAHGRYGEIPGLAAVDVASVVAGGETIAPEVAGAARVARGAEVAQVARVAPTTAEVARATLGTAPTAEVAQVARAAPTAEVARATLGTAPTAEVAQVAHAAPTAEVAHVGTPAAPPPAVHRASPAEPAVAGRPEMHVRQMRRVEPHQIGGPEPVPEPSGVGRPVQQLPEFPLSRLGQPEPATWSHLPPGGRAPAPMLSPAESAAVPRRTLQMPPVEPHQIGGPEPAGWHNLPPIDRAPVPAGHAPAPITPAAPPVVAPGTARRPPAIEGTAPTHHDIPIAHGPTLRELPDALAPTLHDRTR